MTDRINTISLCPQCGAGLDISTTICDYCGASIKIEDGAYSLILNSIGNHPSLIIQSLQTIAENLFSTGRGKKSKIVVQTLNVLTKMKKNENIIDKPILLFGTDDREEAEYFCNIIVENGADAVVQ